MIRYYAVYVLSLFWFLGGGYFIYTKNDTETGAMFFIGGAIVLFIAQFGKHQLKKKEAAEAAALQRKHKK